MKIYRDKITHFRKAKKLTINQVADYLGKHRSTISYWEHGKRQPEKTSLIALASLYGVSVSDISDCKGLPNENDTKITKIDISELTKQLQTKVNQSAAISNVEHKSVNAILKETERVMSENIRLKKENRRLSAQNRSINQILYIKNKNRVIRNVNNNFLFYVSKNYTIEDVIGLKSIDIFGRKEIEDIVPLENKVFETGVPISDIRVKIPGIGETKYGLISIEPIFDDLDSVIEIAVSIKDITDVVENIERLELLENVINKLDDQIWIMSDKPYKYKFLGVNGTDKIYGRTKEEFKTNPQLWFDLIQYDDKRKLKINKTNCTLPLGEHSFRVIHKDGSNRWIKYKSFKIFDKDNKAILYGMNNDITNEIETHKIISLMGESINSMKEAFCILKPVTNEHLFVNRSRELIYGYPYEKFQDDGYHFWLNTCLHPDYRKIEKTYNDNTSWPEIRTFRIIRPDGEIRIIEARATRIIYKGEEYFSFIDRDITDKSRKK
ncbi:MAG TPA: PAS domain-containing protein [Victivallales bacterium]|nr:PAS domain-containing protein [Victivallales bacterium]